MRWLIRGYSAEGETFSHELDGRLGVERIRTILGRLASQHMSCDEIVSVSLDRNGNTLVDGLVRHEPLKPHELNTTGTDYWYTARRVSVKNPKSSSKN